MKNLISLILVYLFLSFALFAQNANTYNKEIEKHVKFLSDNHPTPIDYIFKLYKKNDIVILGERDHRDTTQYNLILELLNDNRFIDDVGNVFLEVGTIKQSGSLQKLLKENIPDSVFHKKLIQILREIEFYPLWEKYNYYQFMTGIYEINKKLPTEQKINIFLTDVSFSWEGMTEEKYKKFISHLSVKDRMGRDSIMAFNFITQYEGVLNSNSNRKKALVIYNGPHSYGKFDCYNNSIHTDYAGKYILEKYKDKVANVMINWIRYRHNEPVAEGKWDAAFRVSGNPSIGFDFNDSPFGDDFFDQNDELCTYARYKDVYTGLIFYLPANEWVCTIGIPDIVDENFLTELVRRHNIIGKKNLLPESLKQYYSTVLSSSCVNADTFEESINRWLK